MPDRKRSVFSSFHLGFGQTNEKRSGNASIPLGVTAVPKHYGLADSSSWASQDMTAARLLPGRTQSYKTWSLSLHTIVVFHPADCSTLYVFYLIDIIFGMWAREKGSVFYLESN
ncbi:hypothetical protein DPMN_141925 [Dreissena polymorpha]|uniref:Uncharacterized protein n=1 Tax=Dreissena polymorpha TaxID=45954 RepID=A0A9D4GA76_DREPO|nr:hypothetical protein DPMN_141925 [Dreissena polymorpha]